MKEIKEKKPRKFLKMLENVGTTVVQEVLLRVIRGVVSRIGGKKQLPSILFLLASCSLFAQYPATGNKQRLGYQTTGDGLVWRGRANDTVALKSSTINNAYIILDTVNNVIYNYIKTKGGWVYNNSDTVIVNNSIDTTSLSNRINLRVKYADTTDMLLPYLRKADTTSMLIPYLRKADTTNMLLPYFRDSDTTSLSNRINLKADKSITLSTTTPLQGGGDLSSNRTLSILSASDSQSGVVNTNTQLFSGNKVFKHRLTADSLLFLNNTTPIPVDILGLNSTGNVNSVGKFTLGSGLSVSTGTLLADTSFLVTRFDTTSMLTPYLRKADTTSMLINYLRTGVAASTYQPLLNGTGFVKASGTNITYDNSTYLTTSSASSTYLPLTGGTVSGSILNSWTSAYTSAPRNDGAVRRTYTQNLYSSGGNTTDRVIHYYTFSQDECCRSAPVTMYYGRFNGFYAQDYPSSTPNIIYDAQIYYNNPNQFFYRAFSESESKTTWSIKPNNSGSTISGTRADMYLSGNETIDGTSSIGGTLGVTGTTTLSGALTVNNATVLNEGSGDYDTRIESDGNANMVFVDASTDRVGIGTNSPSKTLDVNGEVKIATVTATPTALLGKDGSNVVGEVTTVAQTGLFTRGSTNETTGSPSAIFTVFHGLGSNPTSVIVTGAGIAGAEKIIYEVYNKNSTTFSVQAWNYDGTEAANKNVTIYWFAIK